MKLNIKRITYFRDRLMNGTSLSIIKLLNPSPEQRFTTPKHFDYNKFLEIPIEGR